MARDALPGCVNTRKTYQNLISDNVFDEGDALALRQMIFCDMVIDQSERDIYEELTQGPKGAQITESALSILSNDSGYSIIRESANSHRHYHDLANKLIYAGVGVFAGVVGIGLARVFAGCAASPLLGGILLTVAVIDLLVLGVGVMMKYYSESNDIIPDSYAAGLSN